MYSNVTVIQKKLWKTLHDILPSKESPTPSTITVDGEVYTSNEDIAHAFNKHFSSVATKLIDTQWVCSSIS